MLCAVNIGCRLMFVLQMQLFWHIAGVLLKMCGMLRDDMRSWKCSVVWSLRSTGSLLEWMSRPPQIHSPPRSWANMRLWHLNRERKEWKQRADNWALGADAVFDCWRCMWFFFKCFFKPAAHLAKTRVLSLLRDFYSSICPEGSVDPDATVCLCRISLCICLLNVEASLALGVFKQKWHRALKNNNNNPLSSTHL